MQYFISFASLPFYLMAISMQYPKEIQVVRFSMLVLFSALMVVYLLLYQIKVGQLPNIEETGTWNAIVTQTPKTWTISNDVMDERDVLWLSGTTKNQTGKSIDTTVSLFWWNSSNISSGDHKTESIKILSWTRLRYGIIDSVEKLGINYQYALVDDQNIYFVYLGKNSTTNIESIVKKLGGSVYSIIRETEISKNNLFWDTVSYINLPEYKGKKVVMLVNIDGGNWLLQIDYAKYYNAKTYLKNIFIQQ